MKPEERLNWLLINMLNEPCVDVLNQEFVDKYINATNATFKPTLWGAHKCQQLGIDLRNAANQGLLSVSRIGLGGGAWQPGFPKWVNTYQLTDEGREVALSLA